MRRALAVLIALLALPATAHAGWFPAEQVDGPSPDIQRVGDVALGNDGTGVVTWVKREGGADHVFASRLTTGVFEGAERLDGGLGGASSQPVVAASGEGRMVAAWVNEGNLYTSVRAKEATAWTAPGLLVSGGVSNPHVDMSVNGISYISFTQAGDVKVARASRDSATFGLVNQPLDADPARDAGSGPRKRSRVAVSADGTALVVWGEDGADGRTHVRARRLFELRPSVITQDLTLDDIDGAAAGSADTPNLDAEWDSSYAQVVFRQQTAAGSRVVMRRLVGSQFEPYERIDAGVASTAATVALTGRGEGIVGVLAAGGEVFGSTLWDNKVNFHARFDSAGGAVAPPGPVASIGENEDATLAWLQGNGQVGGRFVDNVEKPQVENEAGLANPNFGPADAGGGFDAAATRTGDTAVAFVQGTGADRRVVASYYDKPPNRAVPNVSSRPRRLAEVKFAPGLNLLGATVFRVLVDGRVVGEGTASPVKVDVDSVPEGRGRLEVQSIDRRAQTVVSRSRTVLVDNTPPVLRARFRRRGRMLTVTARAGDRRGRLKSGLRRIVVKWGNGRKSRMNRRVSYRYPRGGTYTVKVVAIDEAGNRRKVTRRYRIG